MEIIMEILKRIIAELIWKGISLGERQFRFVLQWGDPGDLFQV